MNNDKIKQTIVTVKASCGTMLSVTKFEQEPPNVNSDKCLFIHGLDNNSRIWDRISKKISRYMTTYALDIRGHGESGWSHESHYNRARLLEDIDQIRTNLGIDRMYLVGHSLGASLACSFASRYPDMVAGLVLCDMGLNTDKRVLESMVSDYFDRKQLYQNIPEYLEYLRSVYFMSNSDDLEAYAIHTVCEVEKKFRIKTDPKCILALAHELINFSCSRPLHETFIAPLWKIVATINTPLLVLKGEYSSVLPQAVASEIIKMKDNRKLVTIRKAGHALMLDNLDQTLFEIEKFIAGLAKV